MAMVSQAASAACLGLLSHLGIFIHGEHHIHSARIFGLYIVLFLSILVLETFWFAGHFKRAQLAAATITASYAFTLMTSITLYRIFFHPLRDFPGPLMARVTKLWNVAHAARSTNFRLMEDMRRSYGDFVRTGMYAVSRWQIVKTGLVPNRQRLARSERSIRVSAGSSSCHRRCGHEVLQIGMVRHHAAQSLPSYYSRYRTSSRKTKTMGAGLQPCG